MTHRPKARGFCINCSKINADCSLLDFSKMPVISKDKDGVKVVKCTEFIKKTAKTIDMLTPRCAAIQCN